MKIKREDKLIQKSKNQVYSHFLSSGSVFYTLYGPLRNEIVVWL